MSHAEPVAGSADLSRGLAAESAAWQALVDVMTEEEHALVEGEADALPKLNTAKLVQLQALGSMARTRQAALAAAGLAADHAGMDAWLAKHGRPEHRTQWQKLCDLEQQAQAMNERIGVLIEMRLSATRQALNVLIHAATRRNGLYDQAGCSVAASSGNRLTAA